MITQERLKSILHYDPETGLFTWLISPARRVKYGDIAGCTCKTNGYTLIRISGDIYRAHHLVWLYITGKLPKLHLDHINHDRADNRFKNLREVSRTENQKNTTLRSDNTSGVTGVYLIKSSKKWRAQIKADGKVRNLGHFSDKFEAICARKSASNKYGFHENHGKEYENMHK